MEALSGAINYSLTWFWQETRVLTIFEPISYWEEALKNTEQIECKNIFSIYQTSIVGQMCSSNNTTIPGQWLTIKNLWISSSTIIQAIIFISSAHAIVLAVCEWMFYLAKHDMWNAEQFNRSFLTIVS